MTVALLLVTILLVLIFGIGIGWLVFGFGQYNIEKNAVKDGFIKLDGVYYRLTRIDLWDANKDDAWKKVWGDESYYD